MVCRADLVEPIAFLVVDAVHGSALAVPSPIRDRDEELAARRATFAIALQTIVAALAAHPPHGRPRRGDSSDTVDRDGAR